MSMWFYFVDEFSFNFIKNVERQIIFKHGRVHYKPFKDKEEIKPVEQLDSFSS